MTCSYFTLDTQARTIPRKLARQQPLISQRILAVCEIRLKRFESPRTFEANELYCASRGAALLCGRRCCYVVYSVAILWGTRAVAHGLARAKQHGAIITKLVRLNEDTYIYVTISVGLVGDKGIRHCHNWHKGSVLLARCSLSNPVWGLTLSGAVWETASLPK